jgi:hypothetical protein
MGLETCLPEQLGPAAKPFLFFSFLFFFCKTLSRVPLKTYQLLVNVWEPPKSKEAHQTLGVFFLGGH